MDQTELRRKLEEKVAEMVAPLVESNSSKTSGETVFLPSDVFERYMAHEEMDQTDCDSSSKVRNIFRAFTTQQCRRSHYVFRLPVCRVCLFIL